MKNRAYLTGKPLFIIPCSDKKSAGKQAAVELYKGKGYLPLVKKYIFNFGVDFNLAFLSAKHGLVMWDEVISPYDKKLTASTVGELVERKGERSLDAIKRIAPSSIVACLPKVYMDAFDRMLNGYKQCPIAKPAKGGGIGYQRQFLSQQLALNIEKSMSLIVFNRVNCSYMEYTTVMVRQGDFITPWLGNDGNCKPMYSAPVKVVSIEGECGLENAVDEYGGVWTGYDISSGFTQLEKEVVQEKSGNREHWYEGYKYTVELADVQVATRRQDKVIAA